MLNKTIRLIILLLLPFLCITGCYGKMDYSKFDPRCRQWRGDGDNRRIQWNFDKSNPDVDSYYEYFMCLNAARHHVIGETDYFLTHLDQFILLAPSKLASPRSNMEVFLISVIFYDIYNHKAYDIAHDKHLSTAWRAAIDRMDEKRGWPYRAAMGIYLKVTGAAPPSQQNDQAPVAN